MCASKWIDLKKTQEKSKHGRFIPLYLINESLRISIYIAGKMTESEPKPNHLEELKSQHGEALDALERAQNLVLDATRLICPIDGLTDEWSMLGELYDTIKDHWYSLEAARSKILTKEQAEKLCEDQ